MQEIFQAIASGQKAKVIGLLKRDPNLFQSLTEEGITPILFSLYYGKLDISKEIYEISPSRNLFEAVALGDLEETKRLISKSIDLVNSLSTDGWSALHLASYFGHLEIAKFLIFSGADLSLTSKSKLSYGKYCVTFRGGDRKKRSRGATFRKRSGPELTSKSGRNYTFAHRRKSIRKRGHYTVTFKKGSG